jgi:transcriptional regulator with XRE-family HTH domain
MSSRSPYAGSSDLVALGRAVRELRRRRGVPQAVAAFDAGMASKYVGRVERGTLNPSFTMLLRVVRTLGSTMPELIAIYERHLAEIDLTAGRDVPLCPTPEALAFRRQINARAMDDYRAAKARGRMRSWI